jgi:riboflavin kinase / FMN adenylyltransferase
MNAAAMPTVSSATEIALAGRKACVAIGMFDGVHLGHQQVIRQAVSDAEHHEGLAVAITFDRHPNAVVAPARTPPLIYSLQKRLRTIASLGTDATLLLAFDEAFSRKPGESFIRELARDFAPLHSIAVGSNFLFGHQRDGNVALLQKLGAELKFAVHGLSAVALDNQPVSSTRIREAIRAGSFDRATEMLGREYTLTGASVAGDRLGSQLGFPTANLDVTGLALPPTGVYAIHAYLDGARHRAVLNIGHRPTVTTSQLQLRVEAHLLEFPSRDLYGKEIEITFVRKLRDEQRFESLDALKAQIQRDIAQAMSLF